MSIAAHFVAGLSRLFAFDFSTPEAVEKAIRKDREKGPAKPTKKLHAAYEVNEKTLSGARIFRLQRRNQPQAPVKVLYLHGGAFMFGLQPMQWNLVERLLERLHCEVNVPVLPLAPESNWQVTMDFVKRLYLDLYREPDGSEMVVMGDSSGGCLTLLLAQQLRLEQLPVPDALVLISAVLDLSFAGEDQPALEKVDPLFRIGDLRNLIALWVGELRANDSRVSPLFGDVNNLPPTLAISGSWEIFNSDARRLVALNPAIQTSTYEKMIHVWPVGVLKESYRAMDEIATFIQSTVVGCRSR